MLMFAFPDSFVVLVLTEMMSRPDLEVSLTDVAARRDTVTLAAAAADTINAVVTTTALAAVVVT